MVGGCQTKAGCRQLPQAIRRIVVRACRVYRHRLKLCGYTRHRLMQRRARSCEGLRVRQFRAARPIWRLRRVFHDQFDDSPHALSRPVSRHTDTEVDTRCDAATGEPITVDADAFAAGFSAKLAQRFFGTPVHRSTVASQQASGPSVAGNLCKHCTPSGRVIRDQPERRLRRNRPAGPMWASHRRRQRGRLDQSRHPQNCSSPVC